MQVFRRRVRHRHRPVIDRMRNRVRQFDMHAPMTGILHPALHREQVDAVGAEYDMVDLPQPAGVGRDGQCDRSVMDFPGVTAPVARQLANAFLDLRVQPMLRMRRFGEQRPPLRIFQSGQCVFADDAVDMEMMGALEGFDGVEGVGAEVAIHDERVVIDASISKLL